MARSHEEGELRLVEAICMLVERRIQQGLPVTARGIRAPRFSRTEIRQRVNEALDDLVGRLTDEIWVDDPEAKSGSPAPAIVPEGEGRMSVLTNDQPCSKCGVTRRVAMINYSGGYVDRVECERCAPEFNDGGRSG